MIVLESRAGLRVELPESEYAAAIATDGITRARERLLSEAGRALKHRRELAQFYAQEIDDAQRNLIQAVARQLVRAAAVDEALRELGGGLYLTRIAFGGAVAERTADSPPYQRLRARAVERAGNIDDTPDEGAIAEAMRLLGLLTEQDAQWSRRHLRAGWTIAAPDGWDGAPALAAEAMA